jgi:hypothetical protein
LREGEHGEGHEDLGLDLEREVEVLEDGVDTEGDAGWGVMSAEVLGWVGEEDVRYATVVGVSFLLLLLHFTMTGEADRIEMRCENDGYGGMEVEEVQKKQI